MTSRGANPRPGSSAEAESTESSAGSTAGSPARSERSGSFVVVANRLPVSATTDEGGHTTWAQSPGGLVTALEPVLTQTSGMWIGWDGMLEGESDIEPPESVNGYALRNVPLTRFEVEQYYEGFSNATLWPLYHDAIVAPEYHRHTWEVYRTVNERFARVAAEAAAPKATVWVQDYHLQLVPAMLRALRPDLKIGFFLHIPFPPIELFMQLPWRRQVIEGLLGADVVGFHVGLDASNFISLAERFVGAPRAEEDRIVVAGPYGARQIVIGAFPISIDSKALDSLARTPAVQSRAVQIRTELGNPRRILLGVDRLDYTKGIDVRLKAFSELLSEESLDPADTVFMQIATPSREGVEEYQRMRDDIELIVGRTMGDYASVGRSPVQYLHQNLPRDELVSFYEASDIMMVTPLRDGMNLVAKEYVAARIHDDGALVLSEFTGAAEELSQAYLVNPYDTDGLKAAILTADRAPASEKHQRMSQMRAQVFEYDVQHWAQGFLSALDRAADASVQVEMPDVQEGTTKVAPVLSEPPSEANRA